MKRDLGKSFGVDLAGRVYRYFSVASHLDGIDGARQIKVGGRNRFPITILAEQILERIVFAKWRQKPDQPHSSHCKADKFFSRHERYDALKTLPHRLAGLAQNGSLTG